MGTPQEHFESSSIKNTHDPACPNCQAFGQPFEVEEGRGYRRVTYRCVRCHHAWSMTYATVPENALR